ncbi:MAG: SH3 domain-containing protein [Chloroflexi bacterium]|nr:MAG: SH3 domain-containing protein [Chloroflexota bacterium]
MRHIVTISFLCVLILLFVSVVNAQTTNLLQDPGFEGTQYTLISADPTAPAVTFNAPVGWWGGIVQTPGSPPWINAHPSAFPHSGSIRHSGARSLHIARGGATFTAYMYQQVAVEPGSPLEGGAWVFIDNNSATARARVGIDPTGGTDPNNPAIVWASTRNGFQWTPITVNTTAQTNVATLFLFATQTAPIDPNGVFWDSAFLNGIPGTQPITTTEAEPAAPAQNNQQFVTTNVSLRVRRDATINSPRIGAMNPGQSFPLIRDEGAWYAIDFNGRTGYVSSQFATLTGGDSAGGVIASLDYTLAFTVRLRSAPSTDADTLTRIPFNTTLRATGRTADSNWLQVTFNGQSGWVASRFGTHSADIGGLPVVG